MWPFLDKSKARLRMIDHGRRTSHVFLWPQEASTAKNGPGESPTSIVKTRQTNLWHHLPAISCSERDIGLGRGGVPYWRWWDAVQIPHWMRTSTTRWLHVCLSSFDYWCLCSYLPKNYSTQCDQMAIVFSIFWHSNHRKFAQLHTFAKAGTKVCQLPNQKHTKKSQRLLKFAKATKFRQIWSHWQFIVYAEQAK